MNNTNTNGAEKYAEKKAVEIYGKHWADLGTGSTEYATIHQIVYERHGILL